jgi:phosphatidylglycerol:prolipoprotein diacylglycerol transferase
MYPILFKIGDLTIYSYGFILAIDLLVSLYLVIRYSKYFGIDSEIVFKIFIINIIFLIIGGKIGYIFSHFTDYYKSNLIEFLINLPFDFIYAGLAIQGAIIFSVISLVFLSKYYRLNFWVVLDNVALVALFSIFIGRIGCLLAGCCYGKVCNCEYGIYLHGAIRYPTQLMESVLSLVAFIFLYFYFNKLKNNNVLIENKGKISALFFIFYGLIRFFVEFYREEPTLLLGFTLGQLVALIMLLFGMFIFLIKKINIIRR